MHEKRFEVGTACQFRGAATIPVGLCSWSWSACGGDSRVECCYCYHSFYIEKGETKECYVKGINAVSVR